MIMGTIVPRESCRWVLDRLPLLVGGELTGPDRRRVERHLITCPGCRHRHEALSGALAALRGAAEVTPTSPETPTLWPALERQIRETRHAPRGIALSPTALLIRPWVGVWLDRSRWRFRLAAILVIASLGAAGLFAWTRHQTSAARGVVFAARQPIPYDPVPLPIPSALDPAPASNVTRAEPTADHPAPLQVDYDLDHGILMGTAARDVSLKPAY